VKDNFGKYNSKFYEKVYELLLRLKVGTNLNLYLTTHILTNYNLGQFSVASDVAWLSQPWGFLLCR